MGTPTPIEGLSPGVDFFEIVDPEGVDPFEAILPQSGANEDTATYVTTTREFEEWAKRMDELYGNDDEIAA